ncbi:uncharacterized protein [Typha angustifolia]|uniref:uncharacterized protein n=1 Tax=Typha angustifolia TaxID=59011 RepID=UPI003C2D71B3
MDPLELENNEEHTTETFTEQLALLGSPGIDEIYDESPVCPRIGDEYQVEIPSLATEAECHQLRSSLADNGTMLGFEYPVALGLAIPLLWVHHLKDDVKREQEGYSCSDPSTLEVEGKDFTRKKDIQVDVHCSIMNGVASGNSYRHGAVPKSALKSEFAYDHANDGMFTKPTAQECTTLDNRITGNLLMCQKKDEEYIPLPCLSASSWNDVETESFLLGLYIFGKNLVQVRRLLEHRTMGEMLSYYYGKFYRSDAYRRWSECRKIRNRRSIIGQRIFTGLRQQELLSRLLPAISKEAQESLLEDIKKFNEGRASFEEFIFTLKSTVGMQVLVDAIGIGKGKHDLTGIVLDPVRTNQGISIRPEIPIGKACSSLSSGQIIKFLTGDFRLSKARSNDLFWEAVWPRLLARGWHSEQPKDLSSVGSKHCLVFLMPGVKKFSRKKLVKGNHYFDSVSDVLSKVACDPRLLELDIDGVEGSSNSRDENGWTTDTKLDQNGLSDQQRHCYLRPRLPNCNSELLKFTVVDTSFVQGEGTFKLRELRSLPVDATYNYEPSAHSGETGNGRSMGLSDSDESSSGDHEDSDRGTSDGKNLKKSEENLAGKGVQSDAFENTVAVSSPIMQNNGHVSSDQLYVLANENTVTGINCHFSHRTQSSQQEYLSPVSKRRRLATCKREGKVCRTFSISKGHQLKKEEIQYNLDSSRTGEVHGKDNPVQRKTIMNTCTDSLPEEKFCISGEDPHFMAPVTEMKVSMEEPQSRTLIDLNIPPDYEIGEVCTALSNKKDGAKTDKLVCSSDTKLPHDDSQSTETSNEALLNQHSELHSRRHSTRNRPPTTRALEALACGFIGTKRKGRDMKGPSLSNLNNRPSRRARKSVETPVLVPDSTVCGVSSCIGDSNINIEEGEESKADQTMSLSEPHSQSDREGTSELLGVP